MRRTDSPRRTALICGAFAGILLLTERPGAGEGPIPLEMKVAPAKEAIYPGEPLVMLVTLLNGGTTSMGVQLGMDRLEAFSFGVFDGAGKLVRGTDLAVKAKVSNAGRIRVPPRGASEHRVVLNRWCPTVLAPGVYRIRCRMDAFRAQTAVYAECRLKVLPPDETKLTAIYRSLAECLMGRCSIDRKFLVADMLSVSDSSVAVPYILQIITNDRIQNDWRDPCVKGLGRLGTLEAAKALASVVDLEMEAKQLPHIQREAIYQIHRIAKSTKDERILAQCKPVTDRFAASVKLWPID